MARYILFWVTAVVAWSLLLQETLCDEGDGCSCDRQEMLDKDINSLLRLNADLRKYIKQECPVTTTETTLTTAAATMAPETTSEVTSSETMSPPVNPCPEGYLKLTPDNYCYKVILERMSWTEGQARCKRDHPRSHLTFVENENQNTEIIKYLLTFKDLTACKVPATVYRSYSTCGQRSDPTFCKDDNEFVWRNATEKSLEFTHWKEGEPNCYNKLVESCLQYRCEEDLVDNCWWNDYVCSSKICPLCQLEL